MRHLLPMLLLIVATFPALAQDEALRSALVAREGKLVTVMLSSGSELTGKVAAVDGSSLRLAELSGKEFFDAVIALDQVEAVVYRVRDR